MSADSLSRVVKVPVFAVPALLGKNGKKVKDMQLSSGAFITISRPSQESLWAEATILGTQEAINTASLLVKMAILHARAADYIPTPSPYSKDRKAEAEIHMFTFHKEIMAEAYSTSYSKMSL